MFYFLTLNFIKNLFLSQKYLKSSFLFQFFVFKLLKKLFTKFKDEKKKKKLFKVYG